MHHLIAVSTRHVEYRSIGCSKVKGGSRPSPEALLVAAISSCDSITLSSMIRAASLPQTGVSIHADSVIVSEFGKAQFTRLTIRPSGGRTLCGAMFTKRRLSRRAMTASSVGQYAATLLTLSVTSRCRALQQIAGIRGTQRH